MGLCNESEFLGTSSPDLSFPVSPRLPLPRFWPQGGDTNRSHVYCHSSVEFQGPCCCKYGTSRTLVGPMAGEDHEQKTNIPCSVYLSVEFIDMRVKKIEGRENV